MFQELLPLLAALAIAAIVYTVREVHRRRFTVRPPLPDLTLREGWELWRRGGAQHPDIKFFPADAALTDGVAAEMERALPAAETGISGANHPRQAVRRSILENAGVALHLEAIIGLGQEERKALLKGYREGMEGLLQNAWRLSVHRWILLRFYGRLKFDDAVPDDWFQHYMRVARPYIREKVRLAREHVLERNEGSGQFAQVYDQLLHQLAEDTLKIRPKRRFVAPDLS